MAKTSRPWILTVDAAKASASHQLHPMCFRPSRWLTLGFLVTDRLGEDENGGMKDDARQGQETPP